MGADQPRFGKDVIDDLIRRVNELEKIQKRQANKRPHLPLIDFEEQGQPFSQEGAIIVDYRGNPLDSQLTSVVKYQYGGRWWPLNGSDYEIKLFSDTSPCVVTPGSPGGPPRFGFGIPNKVNGYKLVWADAFNTGMSNAGITQVNIMNYTTGNYMLSDPIVISPGRNFASDYVGGEGEINPTYARVERGHLIAIYVEVAPGDDLGLGVILEFSI